MRTFLVLEGAKRLESGEASKLSGTVFTESALIEWAARWLGTPENAPFLVVAEAARRAGIALFALPTRDVRHDDPSVVSRETTIGGRTVLVLRRADDPTAGVRVRWTGDDGGNRETELPGFLADALLEGPASPAIASEPADATPDPIGGPDAPESPGEAQDATAPKSKKRKGQNPA